MLIKKILFGYFVFAVLSGIGLAAWKTVLMLRYYDPYNNEYVSEAGSSLRSLGIAVFVIFMILATSLIVLKKADFRRFSASDHQFSVFTSALLGFVFLAVGILLSLYFRAFVGIHLNPLYRCVQILTYLLSFSCAAYFVLNATGQPKFEQAKKLLAVLTPLFGITFLLSSYLNPAYNYRDYDHTLCNVAICALVFFLLYDTKTVVTGQATPAYFMFSLISLVASAVYMIPTFVLLAYWELSANLNHVCEAVLFGAIFYTCACLVNLCRSAQRKEIPEQTEA